MSSSSFHHHHHHHLPLLLLFLSAPLCLKSAVGAEHRIATTAEFTDFVSSVNSNGVSYLGTTVYLDSDLSLSDPTSPIGTGSSNHFQGVFDGQGHTISNLKITSTSDNTGLFGYSTGMTVRNVVLDESCSVTNSMTSTAFTWIRVGGFVGYCTAKTDLCNIENNVNMASVTFDGSANAAFLYIGGIVGRLDSTDGKYTSVARNCVNYGPVTLSGEIYYPYLGGIEGFSQGSSTAYTYIQNCANYGTITHSGTVSDGLAIGGISGDCIMHARIENCVSAGEISAPNPPSKTYIGNILGYTQDSNPNTFISHCYFTTDVGGSIVYGGGTPTITDTPTSASAIDSTLLGNLNSQATANGWSKWLLNTNEAKVTFKVNDYKGFSLASQLVLLPDLAESEKRLFGGWFTDASHSNILTSYEASGATTLYGLYGVKVAVAFNATGGVPSQSSKDVMYGEEYGTLPSAERVGCTFVGWFTSADGGVEVTSETKVEVSEGHTLYAHWTINQYIITFIFDNGKENEVRTLYFNETIVYPEEVTKTGYTFAGWSPKPLTMPAQNITVTAQWTANKYTVSFDVNGGNTLSETESSKQVAYDSTYGDLPEASRTGYDFIGWFTDGGEEIESTTDVKITGPQTLYAHWSANKYTVTYDVNGGDALSEESKEVIFDSPYGDLPEPSRTGFTFGGWFTDTTYANEVTSESTVSIPNDHTLYVKWNAIGYMLTFIFDNGTKAEERPLNYNDPIEYPADPVKEGHTFNKWNSTIEHMPAHDLTITALWIVNKYTVTFDLNNGSEAKEETLEFGEEIPYPEGVLKEGHTFSGWSENVEFMPARNFTITALWTINNYTLTFDFSNGSEAKEETLEFGEEIPYPEGVLKEGHTFDGWDNNVTNMPAHDLTITAQWSINTYRLVLNFVNGSEPEVRHIAFNDSIEYPESAEKEGHTFVGWDSEVERMPSHDITATAQWTVNNYTLTFIFGNGDEAEVKTVQFNELINYPEEIAKEGHTFDKWNETLEAMPAHDLTIEALWSVNEYTVTFYFKNGTTAKETVKYGEPINYPEGIEREGYKFNGWKPKPRTMPANDLVTRAQWSEEIRFVEITLGTADLSEPEISGIIKKFTDADFTIERLEVDKSEGSIQVIVRFVDSYEAKNFVEKVEEEIEGGSTYFKNVAPIQELPSSHSVRISPFRASLIPIATFLLIHTL